VLTPQDYHETVLQTIHAAILTLCAATGDLFAVLSLPAHYRESAALTHTSWIQSHVGAPDRTLSFGAVYHPWLVETDASAPGELRQVPPDGAASGVMAQRALRRGAWVAPANEPFQGVVALTPELNSVRRLDLQEGRVNVVRQEPGGFVVLCADTLSSDDTLRPINVRRLLMLLRRLAERQGATYVFEPNDPSFRRTVERGFESLLDDLYLRGALAGATASVAYRVNAGPVLNTPASVDLGRFMVELRVAPSRPLTFVTIRLVQTGDGLRTVLEGSA
jgi:phage tail sheath protein FI